MKKTSFSYTLDSTQQEKLLKELQKNKYVGIEVPHTKYAAKTEGLNVSLYNSGKCLIQGKAANDWVLFVLEPTILQTAEIGYESVLNPKLIEAHMGVDESGKGDFFGPLVVASVYVNQEIVQSFQDLNVRESKSISNDKKAMEMAREIRNILEGRFALVKIGPEAYNRIYQKFGNLNKLLAWGHARAIENLLEKIPDCPRAVADQFGPEKRIKEALFKNGKKINLEQRPRAESDPAVAAASVLARDAFINGLLNLSSQFGLKFPKGASKKVVECGRAFINKHGRESLKQVAKCHFKTASLL